MKVLSRFTESVLARNTGWMLIGQCAFVFLQVAYFLVLARLLGSREYGIFVGALAFVSTFTTYSSMGSGWILLRYVSSDRSCFRQYWGNVLTSALLTSSVLVPIIAITGPVLLHTNEMRLFVMIAISDCCFAKVTECAAQAFQAFERLHMTACLNVFTSAIRLGAALALWIMRGHATAEDWAVVSLCVSACVAAVAIPGVCYRLGFPRFQPRLFLQNVREGFGFSVSLSTTSVFNDVDKAMLSHYGMYEANGGYAVAYKIIDIGCLPLRALHAAALPRFFQYGSVGIASSAAFGKRLLCRTLPCAVVTSLIIYVAAPIAHVFVGKGFGNTVSALRWLCLLPAIRALHIAAGDALTCAGHQSMRTAAQFAAAAFNFTVNLYLIPRFSWQGAAWSSLFTDGLLAITYWTLLPLLVKRAAGQQYGSTEPVRDFTLQQTPASSSDEYLV